MTAKQTVRKQAKPAKKHRASTGFMIYPTDEELARLREAAEARHAKSDSRVRLSLSSYIIEAALERAKADLA